MKHIKDITYPGTMFHGWQSDELRAVLMVLLEKIHALDWEADEENRSEECDRLVRIYGSLYTQAYRLTQELRYVPAGREVEEAFEKTHEKVWRKADVREEEV